MALRGNFLDRPVHVAATLCVCVSMLLRCSSILTHTHTHTHSAILNSLFKQQAIRLSLSTVSQQSTIILCYVMRSSLYEV